MDSVMDDIRAEQAEALDAMVLGHPPPAVDSRLTADMMIQTYVEVDAANSGNAIEIRCNDDMLGLVTQACEQAHAESLDGVSIRYAFYRAMRVVEDRAVAPGCVKMMRHRMLPTTLRLRDAG